jgi:hypothetical protein
VYNFQLRNVVVPIRGNSWNCGRLERESPNPYPKDLSCSIGPSAGHMEFIRHESFPGVGHPSTAIVNTTPTACISIESHSIELKLGQFEAKSSFVSLSNVVDGLRTLPAWRRRLNNFRFPCYDPLPGAVRHSAVC